MGTRADLGFQWMKGEDAWNKSHLAVSSTLGAKGRTAMSRLFKAMASLYFTYDVDFRILVEDHRLAVGVGMTGMMYFELVDPPYNV